MRARQWIFCTYFVRSLSKKGFQQNSSKNMSVEKKINNLERLFCLSEAAAGGALLKKMFWKISQISEGNIYGGTCF